MDPIATAKQQLTADGSLIVELSEDGQWSVRAVNVAADLAKSLEDMLRAYGPTFEDYAVCHGDPVRCVMRDAAADYKLTDVKVSVPLQSEPRRVY